MRQGSPSAWVDYFDCAQDVIGGFFLDPTGMLTRLASLVVFYALGGGLLVSLLEATSEQKAVQESSRRALLAGLRLRRDIIAVWVRHRHDDASTAMPNEP